MKTQKTNTHTKVTTPQTLVKAKHLTWVFCLLTDTITLLRVRELICQPE